MAREEAQEQIEDLESLTDDDEILEAADDVEEQDQLVEFQASGEDSSVADPIDTGSSRRKADKTNAMPMPKLGKTGVIQNVVDMFSKMTPGQASKAYKGLMDSSGNKASITTKGDAGSPVKLHTMANIKVKEDLELLFKDKESFIDEAQSSSGTTHADDTYDDDHKGPSTGHHIDALHAMHKKDKHPGVKFHTAQGDSDPHAVSISHDSPARKSKTFMAHVKKLASVPHINEETEDFFDRASTIFEAALNVKATVVEVALKEAYDKKLAEATAQHEEDLETKLDEYLEYVAETWMKENEIAIESALKVEMAENFMSGVKDLFKESLIEIPEDKVDHVSNMESEVEELKKKIDEAINTEIDLKKVVKDQHAAILFNEKSRGMTLKQQDEFKDLVEGLDYDSEEDFSSKLDTILETYFNKKPAATETEINEELVEVENEDKPTGISDGNMAAYAQAISRTLTK